MALAVSTPQPFIYTLVKHFERLLSRQLNLSADPPLAAAFGNSRKAISDSCLF